MAQLPHSDFQRRALIDILEALRVPYASIGIDDGIRVESTGREREFMIRWDRTWRLDEGGHVEHDGMGNLVYGPGGWVRVQRIEGQGLVPEPDSSLLTGRIAAGTISGGQLNITTGANIWRYVDDDGVTDEVKARGWEVNSNGPLYGYDNAGRLIGWASWSTERLGDAARQLNVAFEAFPEMLEPIHVVDVPAGALVGHPIGVDTARPIGVRVGTAVG